MRKIENLKREREEEKKGNVQTGEKESGILEKPNKKNR